MTPIKSQRLAEPLPTQYSTAVQRWAAIGPYYAMFPVSFAFSVVRNHSRRGDTVIDPFAGRYSSVYAAAAEGRNALGVEINSVGWVYGKAKMAPATAANVKRRLKSLIRGSAEGTDDQLDRLPEFFQRCFAPNVLRFLIHARQELDWKRRKTDCTLMALLLVYLHGKRTQALSNQMRQGKAMDPAYSLRWWDAKKMDPPEIDIEAFFEKRIEWRYAKGRPDLSAKVVCGDSTRILPRLADDEAQKGKAKLLFTSPPYLGVTNYHSDQWLRMWLLGGPDHPTSGDGKHEKRFESKVDYEALLKTVFESSAELLAKDATVYVRTDARDFTLETTESVLQEAYPGKIMRKTNRPYNGLTQTALYGDHASKPGEVDIVLKPAP